MTAAYTIETFTLGDWGTNCYLIHGEGHPATLVDAGFGPDVVLERLAELGVGLERVLLTHAHVDHIAGLDAVRAAYPDCGIAIHPDEAEFLTDPSLNLSAFLAEPIVAPEADQRLEAGSQVLIVGLPWEVRHTPGHSPGGVSLIEPTQDVAIVGDTLFANGVGRTDFPTSDPARLLTSIRGELLTLPEATRVLPGHGPETTIGHEREHNPWLQG